MDMSKPNIYQRINAVMQEVTYVQKDKQVSGAGANYKAVTHDQVVSVIRGAMVKHGIVVVPKQQSSEIIQRRDPNAGIKMHLYEGSYEFHYVNIDDPKDYLVSIVSAHAADNGDKAPGKCLTYAAKTSMLKVFNLETGEDDESRVETRDRQNVITQEQYSQLAPYCTESNGNGGMQWSKLGQRMMAAYKIKNVEQLPQSKFDEVLKKCQEYGAQK